MGMRTDILKYLSMMILNRQGEEAHVAVHINIKCCPGSIPEECPFSLD